MTGGGDEEGGAAAGVLLVLAAFWWRSSNDIEAGRREVEQHAQAHGANLPHRLLRWKPPPDAKLRGRVLRESGEPIANARVCAICATCSASLAATIPCVVTDIEGGYALGELERLAYIVSASAEGYRPSTANGGEALILDAGRGPLDFVLQEGGAEVSGYVLDATGGPVAGAELRVVNKHHRSAPVIVYSEAEGRFRAWAHPGAVTIHGKAEGYASLGVLRVAPTRGVEIVLTPGGALRGKVVTKDEGRPLSGATVSAVLTSPGRAVERAATTEGDGSFDLQGLEPGAYLLSASGRGYRGALDEPAVVLGVGHSTRHITIAADRAAQVRGRVLVESAATPCQQGMVTLGPPPPPGPARPDPIDAPPPDGARSARISVQSPIGADGGVHFEAVPAGHYFVHVHCHSHVWRAGPARIEVGAVDISELEWRVASGLGLEAEVVDERGEAVAYARAWLEFPPVAGRVRREPLRMDEQGRHRYPSELLPGHYRLTPAPPYEGDPLELELREGSGTARAVLRLRGSARVEVTVSDGDGYPVDGIDVIGYRTATDDDGAPAAMNRAFARLGLYGAEVAVPLGGGRYRLGPVEPGSYRLTVLDDLNPLVEATAPGQRARATSGETIEVALLYDRPLAVAGRVVDADGFPVPDAWVYLDPLEAGALPSQGGLRAPRSTKLTDGDGAFRFEGLLTDAHFVLRAELSDGSGFATADGVVSGAQVTLTLQAAGMLSGVVIGPEGRAADMFMLEWKQPGSSSAKRSFAHTEGAFSIERIAPGDLLLRALAPEGMTSERAVSIAPGQRLDGLTLQLLPRPASLAAAGRSQSSP